MAYQCPRCGEPVERGQSSGAAFAGGLVGSLIYSAFGGFECPSCGKIPKHEFPPEVQTQMTKGSVMMVGGALVLVAVVIGLLVWLQSM
jgi:hypothetical protein